MSAPILTSIRARSCTCGSHAALPIDGRSRRQRGSHQRVLRRHHRRLVHEDIRRSQPVRRAKYDLATALGGRAHRAERVQVRVQPPAADHVASRRRHHGAPEASQQRARQQERRSDQLRQLALDLDLVHVRAQHKRDLVGPTPAHCTPIALRMLSIASTSLIRGTFPTTTSSSVRIALPRSAALRSCSRLEPSCRKAERRLRLRTSPCVVCAGRGPLWGRSRGALQA